MPGLRAHFPRTISYQDQAERLGGTFAGLQASVERILGGADLTASPAEASPDRALVFEVIGPVADFVRTARGSGLEWLGEDYGPTDEDDDEDPQDADADPDGETPLYVTMPTLAGLQKVLSLWRRFSSGEARSAETTAWWRLFGYLRDVRPWSAKDRVDANLQGYVERMLERHPERPVRLELDLWFRADAGLRSQARSYIDALMASVDGRVLDFQTIEPIHYQAALVELPGARARTLAGLEGPLADANKVMRIRPQSFYVADTREVSDQTGPSPTAPLPGSERSAVACLLDGYPVENHELLSGRVAVKEVDVAGGAVPVARRFHGTAMASLIVHGDLELGELPIDRMLTAIPILAAPQNLAHECTPPDELPIAIVYRALLALVAARTDADDPARRVVVVNHSVCDGEAPFARRPSFWAKLLDHMAHEHRLLFVISAGNTRDAFDLDTYASSSAFDQADAVERQIVLLRSIETAKGTRVMLSPAESLNALTVGAVHADGSSGCPTGMTDPFDAIGVSNLGSSVGLGINRAIKPDLVEHGGRQLVRSSTSGGKVSAWGFEHPDVGQKVAMPDPNRGVVDRVGRSTGTSNAAALVTRAAIRLADVVEELYAENGDDWETAETRAVVLKALLAHGCGWGPTGELLDETYAGGWQRRREAISRFLGYGKPDHDRVLSADGSRITLLADDLIEPDTLHEYRIPVPRGMLNNRELRRMTMTLAWSSPIDPISQRYRGVLVELVDEGGKRKFWDGLKAPKGVLQPAVMASRRGTLQHIVLQDKKLMKTAADGGIFVGVQARSDIAEFARSSVPYAMALTIELAQSVRQDVFADVEARIRQKRIVTRERVPTRVRNR
ncbi:S8 family peptidase [Sphingomonas sp. 4RDLI-65]|uniref:S8 family peptidase n=1 Tax=Sphingomonas sp. 4RDLI-65 TaxID=3111641 RepID=UPI003C1D969A